MSEIDDMFRKAGEQPGFEYREEYWTALEQTLDKKKRGGFRWKTISVAAIIATLLCCWWAGCLIRSNQQAGFEKAAKTWSGSGNTDHAAEKMQEAGSAPSGNRTGGKTGTVWSPEAGSSAGVGAEQPSAETGHETGTIITDRQPKIPGGEVQAPVEAVEPVAPAAGVVAVEVAPEPHVRIPDFSALQWFGIRPVQISGLVSLLWDFPLKFAVKQATVKPADDDSADHWTYRMGVLAEIHRYTSPVPGFLSRGEEQWQPGYAGTALFTAVYKHLMLRAGAGVSALQYRSNYLESAYNYSFDTNYVMVNPNFGTTPFGSRLALIKRVIQTDSQAVSIVKHRDALTRMTYLQIPVSAGYRLQYGKWQLMAEAGISYAALIQSRGLFPAIDGAGYKVYRTSESPNMVNHIWRARFGATLDYAINDRWNAGISVTGNPGLNAMDNTAPRRAGYTSFGLQLNCLLK